MNYAKQLVMLITLLWFVTGCYDAAPNYGSANIAHLVPYDMGVDQCYGLTADDVTPILGEPVTPTYNADHEQGHCIFVSVAASNFAWGENEYLLTYGPAHEHQYVAIAVRPNDSFTEDEYTDPMEYGVGKPLLTFAAKLFDDQARYEQFWSNFDQRTEGDAQNDPAPMLAELATVPSQRATLQRDFLSTVGDGAFWYWQAAKSGHHLAGLYAFINGEQISLQALVAPPQSEAETQAQLVKLAEFINALGESVPETRTITYYDPRPGESAPKKLASDQIPADAISASVGQPFILSPGQSAYLADIETVVIFEQASADAGCVSASDCSQMFFAGAIEVRRVLATVHLNKSATVSEDKPILAYTPCCTIELTSIKKEPTGALVATFIVNQR